MSPGPTCRHAKHVFPEDIYVHMGTHTYRTWLAIQINTSGTQTMPLPALAPSIHINMKATGLILFLLYMEVPLVAVLKQSV